MTHEPIKPLQASPSVASSESSAEKTRRVAQEGVPRDSPHARDQDGGSTGGVQRLRGGWQDDVNGWIYG